MTFDWSNTIVKCIQYTSPTWASVYWVCNHATTRTIYAFLTWRCGTESKPCHSAAVRSISAIHGKVAQIKRRKWTSSRFTGWVAMPVACYRLHWQHICCFACVISRLPFVEKAPALGRNSIDQKYILALPHHHPNINELEHGCLSDINRHFSAFKLRTQILIKLHIIIILVIFAIKYNNREIISEQWFQTFIPTFAVMI